MIKYFLYIFLFINFGCRINKDFVDNQTEMFSSNSIDAITFITLHKADFDSCSSIEILFIYKNSTSNKSYFVIFDSIEFSNPEKLFFPFKHIYLNHDNFEIFKLELDRIEKINKISNFSTNIDTYLDIDVFSYGIKTLNYRLYSKEQFNEYVILTKNLLGKRNLLPIEQIINN
ncbi:MAG: hypothetical protein HW421_1624 [Ignavibacteria bacterium]|nr:hypothetical protein [Ignavibacteria bacterium]